MKIASAVGRGILLSGLLWTLGVERPTSVRATTSRLMPNTNDRVVTPTQSPLARRMRDWSRGWPMVGHDPQRTNRSPDVGPIRPRLLGTFTGAIDDPVIGPNGELYTWGKNVFFALDSMGRQLWRYRAWEGDGGPPAVTPDGKIGVLALPVNVIDPTRSSIIILTPTDQVAWKVPGVGFSKGVPPLASGSGTFYVPLVGPDLPQHSYGSLAAVSSSNGTHGQLLPGRGIGAVAETPAGVLVVLFSDYQGHSSLEALTATGHRLWVHADSGTILLIGKRRTVYTAGDQSITAYNSTGRVLWRRAKSDGVLTVAERADGALLAAGTHWLDVFTPKGNRVRRLGVDASSTYPPALAVDGVGTAYVATDQGRLEIVSKHGRVLANRVISARTGSPSPPAIAIGPNRRLIVTGADGTLRIYGP